MPPQLAAESWLLLEMSSISCTTTEKADERLEPASLTKLMTAYLTFASIHKKTLSLNQHLRCLKRPGSRRLKMFIKVDTQVKSKT